MLRPEWFFPAMLLIIGGRYLCFHTLYGRRTYLLLGAGLALAAWLLLAGNVAPHTAALAGGLIETVAGAFLLARPLSR